MNAGGIDLGALNVGDVLKYGALGLGLALATFAFRLLAREQTHDKPRLAMLSAIYVFMLFSLLLAASGFASELLGKRWPLPPPSPGSPEVVKLDGPIVEYHWFSAAPPPAPVPKACTCFAPFMIPGSFPVPYKPGTLIMFSNTCVNTIDMVFVKHVPRREPPFILDPHFARIAVPNGAILKIDVGGAASFGHAVWNCPR